MFPVFFSWFWEAWRHAAALSTVLTTMAYTAPSNIPEYSEAAPLINVHSMSGYQAPQQSYQIQEAKTYSYDGTCCGCYRDNEDAVISPSSVSISRRYGCGCCIFQDSTVINLKHVESTRVNHPVGGCGLFWAWFMFGCFGWHRFCAGRYRSGFLLFVLFTTSLTLTPMGYIVAEEYNWSGAGWMFLTGIFSSVVLGILVIFWFVDAFFLRGWAQSTVQITTHGGEKTEFKIEPHNENSFRADMENYIRSV